MCLKTNLTSHLFIQLNHCPLKNTNEPLLLSDTKLVYLTLCNTAAGRKWDLWILLNQCKATFRLIVLKGIFEDFLCLYSEAGWCLLSPVSATSRLLTELQDWEQFGSRGGLKVLNQGRLRQSLSPLMITRQQRSLTDTLLLWCQLFPERNFQTTTLLTRKFFLCKQLS